MSYPIDVNIPQVNDDPAFDCPLINGNFVNINGYLSVDHVAPGATGDGHHEQVTYQAENIPGAPPVDPVSISFTANANNITQVTGSASTVAQNFYQNASAVFPLSAIRAYGYFVTPNHAIASGSITMLNSFNVVSATYVTLVGGYVITITLSPGAVVGNNAGVFVGGVGGSGGVGGVTGGTTLSLLISGTTANLGVSFQVLQI